MFISPEIFNKFPELIGAQSTREGGISPYPYGLNLSSHVGDDLKNVEENRRRFYETIGIPFDGRFVYQNQVHSANINVVEGDVFLRLDNGVYLLFKLLIAVWILG